VTRCGCPGPQHATPPAQSAELVYTLQSPLIGGANAALLQIENNLFSAIEQKADKESADAQARRNAGQKLSTVRRPLALPMPCSRRCS